MITPGMARPKGTQSTGQFRYFAYERAMKGLRCVGMPRNRLFILPDRGFGPERQHNKLLHGPSSSRD